jgi:hypothetical protein
MTEANEHDPQLTMRLGRRELVIRQRYETLSIINDIMIAIWFSVGSVLFFSESTVVAGTWLFVIGSVELIVRPAIRLSRQIHLRRMHPSRRPATEAAWDF